MVATSKAMPKGTINGAGWTEMREEEEFEMLRDIHNEPQGSKHVPLQHWNGMDMFNDRIAAANIAVKSQIGMLSQNEQKFIYMAEVSDTNLPDLSFMLGFISFNDRSAALRCLHGTHVFCCSNGKFVSEGDFERQKHLSSVHDGAIKIFDNGISSFNKFRDNRMAQIEDEKRVEVDDRMLADIVLGMHKSDVFGRDPGFIGKVVGEFTAPVPRHAEFGSKSTLWGLENALTETYKTVNPINSMRYAKEFDRIIGGYLVR
jgi:hypothetical protein